MGATTSADIAALVEGLIPFDSMEAMHRTDALRWLASTGDVFRRVPPRTPPKHLVSYFMLQDQAEGAVLLVHHRKAELWLPTGGHVEVGEDPADTVRREAVEELGIRAVFTDHGDRPRFISVTETVGAADARHVDVSLWYLLAGGRGDELDPDKREFAAARWWTPTEVAQADPRDLEPHLGRFLAKIGAARWPSSAGDRRRCLCRRRSA